MTAGGGNLADQMVNSALRYRAQSPLVDSLLGEIGLEGSDINGLTSALDVSTTNGSGAANGTGTTSKPS